MATKKYKQHHVDNTITEHIRTNLGRKKSDPEFVKRGRTVHMTDSDFERAEKKAAELGWSFSMYADIAISQFVLVELSASDNC